MGNITNREFWDFRVKTRAQFTKLAEQIANIDTSGGGGISELTSKMVVDALGYTPYNAANPANYITASALTPYALKTDIPSLVGYATEDFVNNKLGDYATKDYVTTKLVDYAPLTSVQGFENRIGGLEGAVPQLNERVDSNDEQIAILNETTSGHTTSIGTLTQRVDSVEQLAATKLDSSYFTLANIKSTLGISDWALAATKPSYTASEVGATPSFGNVGVNSVKGNGLGYTYATSAHGGHTAGGFISFGNTSYGCQLNGSIYGGELAFRGLNNGTFTDWKTLAFVSDIPTKLSQLTDDVVAGNYLSTQGGTVNGNIKASGNINATSITINGVTITASNGSITVNGNVLATGAITAKAVG